MFRPRADSTGEGIEPGAAQQQEWQLADPGEEIAVEWKHQPQEEDLAVGRLVGLGRIAEGRRDDGDVMVQEPSRRKHQVIAEAVVECQRRLHQSDGHDEGEKGKEQGGRLNRNPRRGWSRCAPRSLQGQRHRETRGEEHEVRRDADKADAAERQSTEHDEREEQDSRSQDRVNEARPGKQASGDPGRRDADEPAETPEREIRREGTVAEVPAEPEIRDRQY